MKAAIWNSCLITALQLLQLSPSIQDPPVRYFTVDPGSLALSLCSTATAFQGLCSQKCTAAGLVESSQASLPVHAAQDSQMHPVKGWGLQKKGINVQDFCLLENSLLKQKAFLFCLKFSCIPKPKSRTGKTGAIHFLADVFKKKKFLCCTQYWSIVYSVNVKNKHRK